MALRTPFVARYVQDDVRRDRIMNWKLWVTGSAVAIFGGILLVLSMLIGEPMTTRYINVALLILGASGGWLMGTVISPYDGNERREFSTYAKAVTAFASGYGVAKLDKALDVIFSSGMLLRPISGFRTVATASAFLIATLCTFVFRRYG
jgi:Na+/H+-translocating membrane pyrophosphatase